jgi:hypothetical protein
MPYPKGKLPMSAELNSLIREVATDHPGADPREIAQHVAKLTEKDVLTEFYAEALVPGVRAILSAERNHLLDGPPASEPVTKGKRRPSPKVDSIRNWWAELLAARVHVGDSHWKTLGTCTVDDLQFCVDERQQLIVRIETQAQNYQKLITLMVKHGARTVADLPPQARW